MASSVEEWAAAQLPKIPIDKLTDAERAFYRRGFQDGAVARDDHIADQMLAVLSEITDRISPKSEEAEA